MVDVHWRSCTIAFEDSSGGLRYSLALTLDYPCHKIKNCLQTNIMDCTLPCPFLSSKRSALWSMSCGQKIAIDQPFFFFFFTNEDPMGL